MDVLTGALTSIPFLVSFVAVASIVLFGYFFRTSAKAFMSQRRQQRLRERQRQQFWGYE